MKTEGRVHLKFSNMAAMGRECGRLKDTEFGRFMRVVGAFYFLAVRGLEIGDHGFHMSCIEGQDGFETC